MAWVSHHAAQRYIERFDAAMSIDQARARIMTSARAIDIAAKFGASCVKLDNGARLILQGEVVVTVKRPHRSERAPASRTMFKKWRRNAAAWS